MLDQILALLPGLVELAVSQYPFLSLALGVMGSLVVLATVWVKATPSLTDDLALEELEKKSWFKSLRGLFERFSLITRK